MKTSRFLLPVLFLLLVGGLLAVAGDPPPTRPAGPRTVAQLDEGLTEATERLERLLALAARDRRFKLIEKYLTYTIEDFGNRRRDIEAEDLLDIMTDADAPEDLRKDAFKALTWKDAMRFDPDLIRERDKSKPRAKFAMGKVTKLLTNKDLATRQLAHGLLVTYFKEHKNDPEVVTYDAVNGTKSQWGKAKAHWNKVLRK